jgi:hypothetical protein
MTETAVHAGGKELAPVRDVQGFQLTADTCIAEAGDFDVLLVPGGYRQQALMHGGEVLGLIRKQVQGERILFSVCTGALLCGAAGVLTGRQVTTHWAARSLMPCYDAFLADARVVVDGNIISAAGVTPASMRLWYLYLFYEETLPPRTFSSPSNMHRTLYSIVVLQKMRRLRFSRAFEESTIRSVPRGRQKRFAMRKGGPTLHTGAQQD